MIDSQTVSQDINRQITVSAFGIPPDAARPSEAPVPAPGRGELLVRTQYAPINPADLNVLEGRYGTLPQLPAVVGNEGAGQVVAAGPGAEPSVVGRQVFYLGRNDCWQDYVVATPDQLVFVPDEIDPRAACMLKVNPATAWLLLRHRGDLPAGSWVVQNAANSGVGRSVIAIAKAEGWRTANFVRRAELVEPLLDAGADVVALDNDDGKAEMLQAIGGEPVHLALNAVGGDSALRIMSMLADGGTHITYGAMGRRPLKIPNSFLIFKGLEIRGLWVSRWLASAPRDEIEGVYARLGDLVLEGGLEQPVDATFPPSQVGDAVTRAAEGGRAGKVLLDFRPGATEGG